MSEAAANDLVENQAMSPDDFHDHIPRIREVADVVLDVPADLSDRLAEATKGLLVPDGLLAECAAALIAGNVVLQGPPGTGKSSLARALASAFNIDLMPVTAHEDWSTFEVIGRQELRVDEAGKERIVPVNGHFTEAVVQCAGKIPRHQDGQPGYQATWLLIDELNRAHPDKAFGELFSVLGSEEPVDIVLGYQEPGNSTLVVPQRFRIIATINSVDKQFVNSLSQGLRRRFTFITLDVPTRRATDEGWGNKATGASPSSREFDVARTEAVRRAVRRTSRNETEVNAYVDDASVAALLPSVFELVERVRYAKEDSGEPYIPIGTAPLIDTLELFLIRAVGNDLSTETAAEDLDWATSVKLVPLFDAGSVNRDKLGVLAASLFQSPLKGRTRRGLLEVASDGLFFVE